VTEGYVLIYADKNYQNSAFKFRDVLEGTNLPWSIFFHEESLNEIVNYMAPAGIVLVYGESAKNTWIRERVKEMRDTWLRRRRPIELVCALYFDPPEKRHQMLKALPEFLCDLDSNSGDDIFKAYIGKLI
jgi:hypothetical protein